MEPNEAKNCETCGESFPNAAALNGHYETAHASSTGGRSSDSNRSVRDVSSDAPKAPTTPAPTSGGPQSGGAAPGREAAASPGQQGGRIASNPAREAPAPDLAERAGNSPPKRAPSLAGVPPSAPSLSAE
jgi:hypothetical protein